MIDLTNQMSYRISNLDIKSQRISYQMSTGTKLENGSDDAVLYSKYLDIQSNLRTTEGLKVQIEKTDAQNNVADSTVGEVKKVLDAIKVDLLKTLNAGMSRNDKKAVARNMEGMRDNLLTLVNTQTDGEFLFSGSNTSQQTYEKDANFKVNGQVDFKGNGHLRNIAVEPNVYRNRGVTAYDVLMYNTDTSEIDGTINFTEHENVVDENGNRWKFIGGDKTKLYKIKEDGSISSFVDGGVLKQEYIPIVATTGTPISYTTDTIANAKTAGTISDNTSSGLLLEVKHNFFDEMNIIINALDGYKTIQDDSSTNGEKGTLADDGEVQNILSNSLGLVTDQFINTNIGHAELGGRNKIFEISLERTVSKITHYNILMQKTNGADLGKLAMESKSLELTYSALYSTISKMNNLSLVNFLK